jgi:hypothetical protein
MEGFNSGVKQLTILTALPFLSFAKKIFYHKIPILKTVTPDC